MNKITVISAINFFFNFQIVVKYNKIKQGDQFNETILMGREKAE